MTLRRIYLGIAVDEYDHFDPLQFAANDILQMAAVLRGAGFEVEQLVNRHKGFTLDRLKARLAEMRPGDLFVMHFAGHGMIDDKQQILMLPGARDDLLVHYDEAIPLGHVEALVHATRGIEAVFLIDACRKPVLRHRGEANEDVDRTVSGRDAGARIVEPSTNNLTVVYACSDRSAAPEVKGLQHGLFSKCVIEGIEERLERGLAVLVDEEFEHDLRERMDHYAKAHAPGMTVKPIVHRNSKPIVVVPARGASLPASGGSASAPPVDLLVDLGAVTAGGDDVVAWLAAVLAEAPIGTRVLIPSASLRDLHARAPKAAQAIGKMVPVQPGLIVVDGDPAEGVEAACTRIVEALTERGCHIRRLPPPAAVPSSPLPQSLRVTSMPDPAPVRRPSWHPGLLLSRPADDPLVRMLVDTSSLMSPMMRQVFEQVLLPWAEVIKEQHGVTVLGAPQEVVRELGTMAGVDAPDNPERKDRAIAGIQILRRMLGSGVLKTVAIGHAGDKQAADDVFGPMIMQLLLKYDVLLLTQDRALGELCRRHHATIAESQAFTGRKHRFEVCRIHAGRLVLHDPAGTSGPVARPRPRTTTVTKVRDLDVTIVAADPLPSADGDEVVTPNGRRLRIRHPGWAGGEGVVYGIDGVPQEVAKIYHDAKRWVWRFDKLRMMVARQVLNRAVAWPAEMLLNTAGQPVGFLMPRVDGALPMVDCVLSAPLLAEKFPRWQRQQLVILARNLANVVGILHERGVVIGDLNPANILVLEENGEPRVKLVDCDSWQFDRFPSPVGMREYTHPELAGINFTTQLRQREHDEFALAVLLFRTLFLGRHPYTNSDEQSLVSAMQEGAFRYPLGRRGDDERERPLRGLAFRIWTHLPRQLQEMFHAAFAKKEPIAAGDWSAALHGYLLDLQANRCDALGNADALKPPAVRVPPARVGDVSKVFVCDEPGCGATETYFGAENIERKAGKYFRCAKCQQAYWLNNQDGDSRVCAACAALFSHPIWFEDMLGGNGVEIANACPTHGGVRSEFRCSTCDFVWSERDFEWWNRVSGFQAPRCRRCRKEGRMAQVTTVITPPELLRPTLPPLVPPPRSSPLPPLAAPPRPLPMPTAPPPRPAPLPPLTPPPRPAPPPSSTPAPRKSLLGRWWDAIKGV